MCVCTPGLHLQYMYDIAHTSICVCDSARDCLAVGSTDNTGIHMCVCTPGLPLQYMYDITHTSICVCDSARDCRQYR